MKQLSRLGSALKVGLALAAAALALAAPASARGRSHYSSHHTSSHGSGDYARAVGSANDPVLSTGWTGGHGARTQHVHDYYRHTRSGRLIHVHGYYRR